MSGTAGPHLHGKGQIITKPTRANLSTQYGYSVRNLSMTCISKDERTLGYYINLPPELYFTPMGLECGHSMSPYLQGSICSYVRSTSLATTEELMEDQLA